MRKFTKIAFVICFSFCLLIVVACEKMSYSSSEKIVLAETVFNEIEFKNSDKVKLKQQDDKWIVSGEIELMSDAQISSFGLKDVTHCVVLKFEFDKERTIDYFKIEGETTKVYSTDKNEENYVGSITSLLDNEFGDDAFCYLILSANTKDYEFVSRYSDGVESVIKLKIDAVLVSATQD